MKPPDGTYRLSSPGAPNMDFVVTGSTAKSTLDEFDFIPAQDLFKSRHVQCAIECSGEGTFLAFVGVSPGFVVAGTCVKIA